MELDPSHEPINGPLTPASTGVDRSDDLRVTVNVPHNGVKYPGVAGGGGGQVRELTPQDTDSDGAQDKHISADDCISPSTPRTNCSLCHLELICLGVDESMKKIVLEAAGDLETLHEGYFTWEIRNYGKLNSKTYGPEYELGGYKW